MFKFGEKVEGYDIPVLNEREIRASAGILFLATFLSLMFIIFRSNFVPLKYTLLVFLGDFLIRVLFNPKFAPTLVLARLIVGNQTPEYVGAPQKRFAWIIGVVLASTMFFFFIILNSYCYLTGIICLICLIFLFFESAFGICLGCMFYPLFFKEKTKYCPGDVCEVKKRDNIQKVCLRQILILLITAVLLYLSVLYMNDTFKIHPTDLNAEVKTESIQ